MDRLVEENTKKVKIKTENKETKEEVKNNTKVENKEVKVQENKSEEKSTVKAEEKPRSLMDRLVEENTKKVKIKTENKETKEELKNNTKVENKEVKVQENKSEDKASVKAEEKPKNLLDSLIQENKNIEENSKIENNKQVDKKDIKIENKEDKTSVSNDSLLKSREEDVILKEDYLSSLKNKKINSKDVLTNIYLGNQKTNQQQQDILKKHEALKQIKDGTSTENIKEAAKKLDLGLESLEIKKESEKVNRINTKSVEKRTILDKIVLDKTRVNQSENKIRIDKSIEANKAVLNESMGANSNDTDLVETNVNVSPSLAQSIQSRIIGAKQQMSSMMSDIARKMYENYKPPVTAFRINLHPSNLGSIAILMKTDKDNGIKISLNISNNSTLDAFVNNESGLKNALSKTFDENSSSFDLDFSSQDGNSSNSNGEQANQGFNQERVNTQSILNSRESNKQIDDEIDYM